MAAPASAATAYASGWISSLDTAANADGDAALEAELVALARAEGPLRAVLAELCARFVEGDGFERLGFASLADWAAERVGRSGRTIYDHARVGAALRALPELRAALVCGRLGFAKVRLVARAATPESERRWIAFARGLGVEALAREVRRIDGGSLECGGLARDERRARRLEFACSAEVVGLWGAACSAAQHSAGRMLRGGERAELIAAEVASALPVGEEAGAGADCARRPAEPESPGESQPEPPLRALPPAPPSPWLAASADPVIPLEAAPAPAPRELAALLESLDGADAFELEARLRAAVAFERRSAAELGPRLEALLQRGAHLAFGHRDRETYQRERLGLDPSWCRTLLRVERASRLSPAFGAAWRAGELTFLQASALVPLAHSELPESAMEAWLRRARAFTLRRLRDDVEAALALRERDPRAWLSSGGLPEALVGIAGEAAAGAAHAEAEARREIGAKNSGPERDPEAGSRPAVGPEGAEREIGAISSAPNATPGPRETCRVAMILDGEAAQLFRAVHCSVRRRLEREVGRPVTPGEALGWMSLHALRAWGVLDAQGRFAKLRREHRVFARDGWRCAVPACTRMRGLHAHHVVYRSQGGGNERENLVTLCAYHHLRGVHAGRLRIRGRAPHALRFELGIRAGRAPLAVYASGDRKVAPLGPPGFEPGT